MVNQAQVLCEWQHALRREQTCHLRCVANSESARWRYGLWSTVLSAFVGTTIFATLQAEPALAARVFVGILSILSAVLCAIQIYVKESDKLDPHRAAATEFDNLRREVEARLPAPPASEEWMAFEQDFRGRWKAATDSAPAYPQKVLDAAEEHMKRRTPFTFPYSSQSS